ncbi:Six-hairpin glycosidase-like protein [Flagelloscypha sp. PMI_526]|nr:Six-hairpin glycosidase-like protein [Flagelloscypha sp. PMI_526]
MRVQTPLIAVAGLLLPSLVFGLIDRQKVVSKYNIIRTSLINNATTPLQVGNGNFAFNVDNTGLQTFLPFNTLSGWAWHNDSLPADGEQLSDYHGVAMLTHGCNVSYDIPDPNLPQISQWIIGNPNRLNLGRIGLKYQNATLSASLISEPRQELDLWNGVITSTFLVNGESVTVVTRGDFESDAVAIEVDSKLISTGDLAIEFDFPYPPIHSTTYKYEVFAGVYTFPQNHTTSIVDDGKPAKNGEVHIYHELQATSYYVNLGWDANTNLELTRNEPQNSTAITAHRYTLGPPSTESSSLRPSSSKIAFTALFSPKKQQAIAPSIITNRNSRAWNRYWNEGGFVDLTASSNPKANELQRRIINSQYHVRVNSAANGQSPQESGLMNNGWYGKFHMEMVVWHLAHWSTWGRQEHFDNVFPSLYEHFLPSSLARAQNMGWEGARSVFYLISIGNRLSLISVFRWPKMTDPLTGVSSPGGINGLLMWQQPHPMYLATLAYRASPTVKTLRKWDRVLTATADYMASYAWKNETSGRCDLGPPAYGVTENSVPAESLNLGYEACFRFGTSVAYWRFGLDVAREWKKKLGQQVPEKWTTVAENLATPPVADDGLYAQYEGLDSSWWQNTKLNGDPRSMIMLQGILPDTPAVNPEIARMTADKVWEIWPDANIRGWGRPVLSINSARIGNPERAIYHLTAYDYWIFDDAGFAVRGGDGGTPPPFMPGNAGFLYAVAYMVAGWEGSEGDTPGFPKDGSWSILHEGLHKAP